MSSKNEAKIRFTAETQEFQSSLKDAKNEIKTLNAELKLNAAEMKNAGESGELLEKRHELLTQKLEANIQQQEALSGKIEAATEIYGEDSEEVANLERQLTYAQTAQQNIEADINNVNERLVDQAAAAEQNESALGQLMSVIQDQQSELQNLQEEYINTALELGTDSDAAEALAERIQTLSGELGNNQQVLDEVTTAAQNLGSGMDGVAGETGDMNSALGDVAGIAGQAGGELTGMLTGVANALATGGVAGGVMAIASALIEVGKEVIDTAMEFEEGSAIIVEGTGLMGDELDRAKKSAEEAFAAIANADATLEDAYGTASELITRLGMEEGSADLQAATTDMLNFAKVTGEDAVKSVDMFSDVLMNWNMGISDLPTLMNEVTAANQNCDAGVSSLMNDLITYAVTWQDLGYSTGEALGQLVAWEQAGLNADQVIRGLDRACKGLAETNTADIPGAIQNAMVAVSEAETRYDGLNVVVGDTGKTISDLFGQRMAGTFVQAMQNNRVATDQWTQAVVNSKNALATTAAESTTMADTSAQSTYQLKTGFMDLLQRIGEAKGATASATTGVQVAAEETKVYSSELEKLGEASNDAAKKSEKLGESASGAMKEAKYEVEKGISSMQNALKNMEWRVPRPQLPVFSMNGKFDAATGGVPTIGVTWHAEGGIFNQPTLLTSVSGALHGVGESGPEAIAPLNTLQDYIMNAIHSESIIDYDIMADKVGHVIAEKLPAEIAKMNITMDIDSREVGRVIRSVT